MICAVADVKHPGGCHKPVIPVVTCLTPLIARFKCKGSVGHALAVRIRTGTKHRARIAPAGLHKLSGLIDYALGRLRYQLTHAPPPAKAARSRLRPLAAVRSHGQAGVPTVCMLCLRALAFNVHQLNSVRSRAQPFEAAQRRAQPLSAARIRFKREPSRRPCRAQVAPAGACV